MEKINQIKRIIKKLICFYIFFLSILHVNAQSPYYYTLSEENGLPSSEVYQVKQDAFGFIWVGSDAGLFRYDGIRFKQYFCSKENGRSIAGLQLDQKGKLWCQNFTGQLFYVEQDSMILFKDFSKEMRVFPQFAIDKENNVWISSEKFIRKYNYKGDLIANIIERNDKGDTIAWADIEVTAKNEIIAASYGNGLCELVKNGNSYKINWLERNIDLAGRSFFTIVDNRFYIITENELGKKYVISELKNDKTLKIYEPINLGQFVYTVSSDRDGNLWVGTSDGLYKINKTTNALDVSSVILKGDKISSFYNDKEGDIWLSSLQNGIHVIPNLHLYLFDKENSTLKDNYISSVTSTDNDELLVGTYSGVIYKLDDQIKFDPLFTSKNVSYRSVKKILPYKDGYLISRGQFSFVKGNSEKTFVMKNARDFCVLNDTIYFTLSHFTGFISDIDKVLGNNAFEEKSQLILAKAGRSIVADPKKNKIYFAANDGVYEYSNNILKPILYNKDRISAGKLYFENNKLWIATINSGFLSCRSGVVTNENEINSIIKGERIKTFKVIKNILWVATEICLNKIDLSAKKAQYFDLADGLLSKEINDIAFVHGSVYLATNKGLIKFPIDGASVNKVNPEIQITDISLNDSIIYSKDNQFAIKYDHNKLKIKFISSCLRARGKFFYKYRMLGLDTNWVVISAVNNQVIYSSLPSGNFVFEVKAINEDGIESIYTDTLKISVNKPFWQQVWFYILIALSGGLLVFLISVIVIGNIKKKARVKNELVSSQLTAIRAQMNPHFMYNTLNSIQDLILKNEIKNTNYYLSKFSLLMRKILEFSEAERIALDEEIEMLRNYLELEKLRFGNDFKFTFYISEEVDIYFAEIPSLIIQPFVENAIKHGLLHKKGTKELYIAFNNVNNTIVVSIEDNGVGRKMSQEINLRSELHHKSFAVGATQKRLDLLNQERVHKIKIEIIDKEEEGRASGTLVKLYFPLD